MPYPTVEAAYGLVPVNLIGGQVYAGGVRHLPIASDYAVAISNGDAVKLIADGTIEREAASAAMVSCGVFVGCQWTDVDRGLVNANRYPADVVADDIMAIVVDDPAVVMKVAVTDAAGAPATVGRDVIGSNVPGAESGVNAVAHGRSLSGVDASAAAVTATIPFRVLDVVEETVDATGLLYSELLVMWNAGHQYNNTTGV